MTGRMNARGEKQGGKVVLVSTIRAPVGGFVGLAETLLSVSPDVSTRQSVLAVSSSGVRSSAPPQRLTINLWSAEVQIDRNSGGDL